MPARNKHLQSPETIALYDRLIATHPEIERKGDANPYTSLNGNMFTMLSPSGCAGVALAGGRAAKVYREA